jgi:hypothetical protein
MSSDLALPLVKNLLAESDMLLPSRFPSLLAFEAEMGVHIEIMLTHVTLPCGVCRASIPFIQTCDADLTCIVHDTIMCTFSFPGQGKSNRIFDIWA